MLVPLVLLYYYTNTKTVGTLSYNEFYKIKGYDCQEKIYGDKEFE